MAYEYGFQERLALSQGVSQSKDIGEILMQNIPGATGVEKAGREADRNGTDWWVDHESGNRISVDCKVRETDYAALPEPKRRDDLALETWSVVEASKVGWTRDQAKRTDYILWFWLKTGRWCLVPFAMLCGVFQEKWEEWQEQFFSPLQATPLPDGGKYHSQCVFVPRKLVWAEIYKKYGGTPGGTNGKA